MRITKADFKEANLTKEAFQVFLEACHADGADAFSQGMYSIPGNNLPFCKKVTGSLPLVFHGKCFETYRLGWQSAHKAKLLLQYPELAA